MTNEATKDAEETKAATAAEDNNLTANDKKETVESEAINAATSQQQASENSDTNPQTSSVRSGEETAPPNDVDFGAILEQFEQDRKLFYSGEMVSGTVVGISDRGVLIDFGYKSEGFVPIEEFTTPEGETAVSIGDTVDVVIKSIHSGDGAPQLSRLDAVSRKVWDDIEAAYREGRPVVGRILDKTRGGLKVDINGVEAFLPGSQIDSRPVGSLDPFIGQEIEARIIKFSRKKNNIVLSRKVITDEVLNERKAQTLAAIDVDHIVEGTIKNLTDYGAFVDIGGIDGLLHVTDMSWGRLNHPGEMFRTGDVIQVKILKLDREKEKISLGYKQLLPDPWSTVAEVYPVDAKVRGVVSSVTDYGVFVELEPGVEGLVHVSEISWSKRAPSPKKLYQKGQPIDVKILGVDTAERRISLGIKQFQENPWDTVNERYPVGSRVSGKVRNITEFGAFVELEEGIDGLVHISDLTWSKKIKHPKELLKKDQEVEAIVTHIDKANQRLSLSMKDLTPSAWEGFIATHRPGDVVKGKVSRFTNFGVFVELGEGLEGLCHISELSDERVEKAESIAKVGDEMDFKILRIEPKDQKIALSHRAVGKEDEPVVDTRIYTSEAKGGMASLGELAKLNLGVSIEQKTSDDTEDRKVSPDVSRDASEDAEESSEGSEIGAKDDAARPSEEVSNETGEVGADETAETGSAPTEGVEASIDTGNGEAQAAFDTAAEESGESPAGPDTAADTHETSDPADEGSDEDMAEVQEGSSEEPKDAGGEEPGNND